MELFALILIPLINADFVLTGSVAYQGLCSEAKDCNQTQKLDVCWKASPSCNKGKCTCAAKYTYSAEQSSCIIDDRVALVGEDCLSSTGVVNGECNGQTNKVQCETGTTNTGYVLCRGATDKLLGEDCTGEDTCYSYKEKQLARTEQCSQGVCGCSSAPIWDSTYCRGNDFGDTCRVSSDCPGTLRCIMAKCGCRTTEKRIQTSCFGTDDYGPGAEGSDCSAHTECQFGFFCGVCDENSPNSTCIKFMPKSGSPITTYLPQLIGTTLMIFLARVFC